MYAHTHTHISISYSRSTWRWRWRWSAPAHTISVLHPSECAFVKYQHVWNAHVHLQHTANIHTHQPSAYTFTTSTQILEPTECVQHGTFYTHKYVYIHRLFVAVSVCPFPFLSLSLSLLAYIQRVQFIFVVGAAIHRASFFYSNHSVIILNSLWMILLVCGGTLNSSTVCCCCWCFFLFCFRHSSMVRLFSVVMSRRFYYCLAEGTVRFFCVFSLLLLLLLLLFTLLFSFFSLFGFFLSLLCSSFVVLPVPMQSAVSQMKRRWAGEPLRLRDIKC